MFDAFWQFYQDYEAAFQANGDPGLQTMECDGAAFEVRISMGIPRARMKLPQQLDLRAAETDAAIRAFAARHRFALDFRDDSWVITGDENVYFGRIRPTEVWFTPEKFADRRALLDELAELYVRHGTPASRPAPASTGESAG